MIDMSGTITPKSDQTNSEDLLVGPKTIRVTGVVLTGDEQQPVAIDYEGCNGRPYKPCKSMRRVLVALWGSNAGLYIGRSMTLYCDQSVAFGGSAVGGIRISAMSDIAKDSAVLLTVKRAVRKPFQVKKLVVQPSHTVKLEEVISLVSSAKSEEDLKAAASLASGLSPEDRATVRSAFADARFKFASA